uniref:Activin_recp domain-containing protein n=1 Tax=Steinernema glaseri TaxID=37863 RepID=A0A1I7YRU5_9BILA
MTISKLLVLLAAFLLSSASALTCHATGEKKDCSLGQYCFFLGKHVNGTVTAEDQICAGHLEGCSEASYHYESEGDGFYGCCKEDLCNENWDTLQASVNRTNAPTRTTQAVPVKQSTATPASSSSETNQEGSINIVVDESSGVKMSTTTLSLWVALVKIFV